MAKKPAILFLKGVKRSWRRGTDAIEKLQYDAEKKINGASIDIYATAVPIILEAKAKTDIVRMAVTKATVHAGLFQMGGEPAVQLWEMAKLHFGIDVGKQLIGAMSGDIEQSLPDVLSQQSTGKAAGASSAAGSTQRLVVARAYDEVAIQAVAYAAPLVRSALSLAKTVVGAVEEAATTAALVQMGGDPACQMRESIKIAAGVDIGGQVEHGPISIPRAIKDRLGKLETTLEQGRSPGAGGSQPSL